MLIHSNHYDAISCITKPLPYGLLSRFESGFGTYGARVNGAIILITSVKGKLTCLRAGNPWGGPVPLSVHMKHCQYPVKLVY